MPPVTLGILIPKGWVILCWVGAGATALLADIQFSNTITVGSIITAAIVIVASGAFTLRNNMRSFWRELAEERAAQIAALDGEIKDRDAKIHELQEQARADMIRFAEEQRAIRHDLKNQLAASIATLKVEQTKTDLTALLELLGRQHSEAMTKFAEIAALLANHAAT